LEEKSQDDFQCRGLRQYPALCKKCRNKHFNEKYNQAQKAKELRLAYDRSEKAKEKKRLRMQNPEVREKSKLYHKIYGKKPDVKDKDSAYKQRPEIKERRRVRAKMPDRVEYCKNYMAREGVKDRLNGYRRQKNAAVDDTYAKQLIYKRTNGALKATDIPQDLIELQRQSILLKRTIKQKNEQHSTTNI
jgi:hypothetical protein